MKITTMPAAILALMSLAVPARSADLEGLAKKLEADLLPGPKKRVAVLSFTYPNNEVHNGSFIVQERLTTFLSKSGKLEVIERSLLEKVLAEHKLEQTGILDPKSTEALGNILGVDTVVTGSLIPLDEKNLEVNARAIETKTGKIRASGQGVIEKRWIDAVWNPDPLPDPKRPYIRKPLVQIALLLDTSNSMDGLIHQAKTQLWRLVNEVARGQREGMSSAIEVALYEYGNNRLHLATGYIRQVLPFTRDLDAVSEQLFALSTFGGNEYCGQVIEDSIRHLAWSAGKDVYKAVFIAGNEPFTQGPVSFQEAVALAAGKGIVVNTLFCGNRQEGIQTSWKTGADLGAGEYMSIDQTLNVAAFRAPQDEEIIRLGNKMNDTFVPYGREGAASGELQKSMDFESQKFAPEAAPVERSIFKAQKQYAEGASWDVVSRLEQKKIRMDELKAEELPAELRDLPKDKRDGALNAKLAERESLRKRLNELNEERRRYIQEKQKETARNGEKTLDQAMLGAIQAQAGKMKFQFPN